MGFRRSWLGLLGTLAVLPAFAQVSNLSRAQNVTEVIARRQHGLIRDKSEHRDTTMSVGSTTSSNWSGYAVLGSSFTSARGSWVVPTAVCTGVSGDQYASFWVGLDGYSSSTVEQTGTDSDCDGTKPSYYAWFEFYPGSSYELLGFPIAPGNIISASVVYNGAEFTVTITNESAGVYYTTSSRVSGAARSSAEWITEAPCCTSRPRDGILPLSDFVTIGFGSDYTSQAGTNSATDSTTSGPIGNFPTIFEINKVGSSSSPQISTCTALSSDGTSFSCTWGQ
jgi:Peptidase A4 family